MSKLELLVPLDNTSFSERILPVLKRMFDPERARLKLLHIAQGPTALGDFALSPALVGVDYGLYLYGDPALAHPIQDKEELAAYRDELRQSLQRQVGQVERLGFEAQASVLFGSPAAEILRVAEEEPVDLIAMATHARSGFDRFLLGSVAQDVLKATTTPMLLVPFEEDEEA